MGAERRLPTCDCHTPVRPPYCSLVSAGLYLEADANMPNHPDHDPPPLFRTWGRLYIAVLLVLLVMIVLLYWLTESYVEVRA